MPKVSIIIPVYNVEKYIRQALDSVVNQTLQDIEIICVNDCTPDNSFEIVKEYALKDSRFVLLEQETNQGQGVARNRALDIATGDYIMFLDPDDWYELNACEKAYNQIVKNNNEMVFFNLRLWKYKKGKIISNKISNRLKKFHSIKENQHINLMDFNEAWLTSSYTVPQIYLKEFLDKNNVRYSNERFTEDIPFFIKAVVCSKDISILDEPIYNVLRKMDTSVYDYYKHYEDVLIAKDRAREIILSSKIYSKFYKNYLLYEINSDLTHLKKFCRKNKIARLELYPKIRMKFYLNSEEILANVIKNKKIYKEFMLVIDCKTYEEYRLKRFINKILNLQCFFKIKVR